MLNEINLRRMSGDVVAGRELSEFLYKLRNIVRLKFISVGPEYFESLGCEVVCGPIEFLGDDDHVPVSFVINDYGRAVQWRWNIKIPVEMAWKILVLGDFV